MAKVLVPLATGFEEIEAVTVIDVLRRGGVEVVTASIEPALDLESAHGIKMRAETRFADVEKETFDAIVLPGGAKCAASFCASEPLHERLRKQKADERLICAICAAPTALVAAGVLDSKTQITCYPTCKPQLDREWVPAPVVADGLFITSQAPGTAMLFALVVLRTLMGDETMERVSLGLMTDVLS